LSPTRWRPNARRVRQNVKFRACFRDERHEEAPKA
jgi:hypothetical protein